ncbi:MAG: adenosylcobinamide-phosphate synthase CbiB [Ardenticatenaceae bacterium]|nr:adenosylcobinamide-phosphate synthase CbiB [Ardenticatenaceae bacterium]
MRLNDLIRLYASYGAHPLAAVLLDALLGEPPAHRHPVVWMGRWLSAGRARAPRGDAARFAFGAAWVAIGLAASALGGALTARVLGAGVALWPVIAWRTLWAASGEVERALAAGDLEEARRLVRWHLVSRETSELSATEVAEAAIESVAENLTDSWVAPLLAYTIGGVPLAWAYRFLNTADAMWGYRDAEREWLGKAAARLDDLANWLPARLAAVLLMTLGGPNAGRTALREQWQTPSPNGGWTMAAMAGALETTLSKQGVYALPGGPRPADAQLLRRARWLATSAAALWVLLVVARSENNR